MHRSEIKVITLLVTFPGKMPAVVGPEELAVLGGPSPLKIERHITEIKVERYFGPDAAIQGLSFFIKWNGFHWLGPQGKIFKNEDEAIAWGLSRVQG